METNDRVVGTIRLQEAEVEGFRFYEASGLTTRGTKWEGFKGIDEEKRNTAFCLTMFRIFLINFLSSILTVIF